MPSHIFISTQDALFLGFSLLSFIVFLNIPRLKQSSTPDLLSLANALLNAVSHAFSALTSLFSTMWIAACGRSPSTRSTNNPKASDWAPRSAEMDYLILSSSIGLISHVLCVVVVLSGSTEGDGCGYVTKLFITLRRQLLGFVRRGGIGFGFSSSSPFASPSVSRSGSALSVPVGLARRDMGVVSRGVSFVEAKAAIGVRRSDGGGVRSAAVTGRRVVIQRDVRPCVPQRTSSLGRVQAIVPRGWRRGDRNRGQFKFPESSLDARLFSDRNMMASIGARKGGSLRRNETA